MPNYSCEKLETQNQTEVLAKKIKMIEFLNF